MRVLSIIAAALFGTIGFAAQEPYKLRVEVPLVSLEVFVDDVTGKPITNLTREDFTVFEDGQPREIRNFASAETPFNILLLFDRSSSTSNQWQFLMQAVSRLMQQLPDHHKIALAAFDSEPKMLMDWRNPRTTSRENLTIRVENAGTNVYKALEWAARELRGLKGRKGVIVFTDGIDNRIAKDLVKFDANNNPKIPPPAEDRDFIKAVEAVMQAAAPFYFVAVNTDVNSGPGILTTGFELQLRQQARLRMELAADRSNGYIHFPKSLEDIGGLYERIGHELGNSYSLGFSPSSTVKDGKFHKVEIRVRDKNLRVTQSRDGYHAR
jgi:Ca-activated chloride channel homolog